MFSDFNDFFFDDLLGANEETKAATSKWLDSILQNDSRINWKSKKEVLELVEDDGDMLRFASAELQDDEEVVWTAVKACGRALDYASERLQHDKSILAFYNFTCHELTYEEMLKEMDLTDEFAASAARDSVEWFAHHHDKKIIEERKALLKAEQERQMKEKELKKKDPEEPGDSGPSNG